MYREVADSISMYSIAVKRMCVVGSDIAISLDVTTAIESESGAKRALIELVASF